MKATVCWSLRRTRVLWLCVLFFFTPDKHIDLWTYPHNYHNPLDDVLCFNQIDFQLHDVSLNHIVERNVQNNAVSLCIISGTAPALLQVPIKPSQGWTSRHDMQLELDLQLGYCTLLSVSLVFNHVIRRREDGVVHGAHGVITWSVRVCPWIWKFTISPCEQREVTSSTFPPRRPVLNTLCCSAHTGSSVLIMAVLLGSVSNIISLVISIAWPVLSRWETGKTEPLFSRLDLSSANRNMSSSWGREGTVPYESCTHTRRSRRYSESYSMTFWPADSGWIGIGLCLIDSIAPEDNQDRINNNDYWHSDQVNNKSMQWSFMFKQWATAGKGFIQTYDFQHAASVRTMNNRRFRCVAVGKLF